MSAKNRRKPKITKTKTRKQAQISQLIEAADVGPPDIKGIKKITQGLSVTSKNQLPSRTFLSKVAALARIQKPIQSIIEEDLKNKLDALGPEWKQVSRNPALFEGFKQIAALLEWPQEISKDRKNLVWNVKHLYKSLTLSTFGLFEGHALLITEGTIDKVEYRPFETNVNQRTFLQIPFPEPSPHHLRTIQQVMEGVSWQDGDEPVLKLVAPTFYECWVKAGLAASLCIYQISRTEIQNGLHERRWLYALGELHIQNEILRDILAIIGLVQKIQTRYLPPSEERKNWSGSRGNFEDLYLSTILRNPPQSLNESEMEAEKNQRSKIDGQALLNQIHKDNHPPQTDYL